MKSNKIYLASVFSIVLLFLFILYSVIKTEYTLYTLPVDFQLNVYEVNIKNEIGLSDFQDLSKVFSRINYNKSKNVENISTFEQDLKVLDSIYPGKEMEIRSLVSSFLTDSLKNSQSDSLFFFNPNYLVRLQNWSMGFYYYSKITPNQNNSILYSILSRYWGKYVSSELSRFSNTNSSLKNNFSYKFLEARSGQYKHIVNTKTNNIEKVIQYIVGQNWAHLFKASWEQASNFQKWLFGVLILITLISYYLLGVLVINKAISLIKK
jgi:hypothetical protein